MMEEEWLESDEEAEVQVLVLSPRCWAVSSLCFLDEPIKYFPAELCSYLNQFTQFYTHSQYQFTQFYSWYQFSSVVLSAVYRTGGVGGF